MVALRILVQPLALRQTDVAISPGFLFIDAYLITPERNWGGGLSITHSP